MLDQRTLLVYGMNRETLPVEREVASWSLRAELSRWWDENKYRGGAHMQPRIDHTKLELDGEVSEIRFHAKAIRGTREMEVR